MHVMAWHPSPKVDDCRSYAKRWGKDQVIVLAIDIDSGSLELVTYGATKALCREAARLGDKAYAAIMMAYEPKGET